MSGVVHRGSAVMQRNDNRVFHYAVIASILLHGVLLTLAPRQEAKRSSVLPGPIVARLMQPAAVSAPPQAEPQKPQAEPQTPPAAEPPPPSPKPSPIAKPAPKAPTKPVAPASPQPTPTPTAKPSPEPAAPAAPAAPASPAPGPVAKAEPQPGTPATVPPSADDAGSLAQYRMQLIGVAKRYKRYPRVAMDNNWEGDVVVRMVIGANGMISSVTIKTSSGHEILDKQAIDMFTKAKPLVPIPGALRGKEFAIEVRAIYNLKDPDSG